MQSFKIKCDEAYEAGTSIISDAQYDATFGMNAKRDARNCRTRLPFWMGSLDKVKNDKELDLWLKSIPLATSFLVSAKVDGVSALCHGGKLYSKGTGSVGMDWTLKLASIPSLRGEARTVRGELVVLKSVFETKYKERFSNARNLVAGKMNSDDADCSDVQFIPYELIEDVMKPSRQLVCTSSQLPWVVLERGDVNEARLSSLLCEWRATCDFDMDGVVVTVDEEYERNTSGNPAYAVAFKQDCKTDAVLCEVDRVEWSASMWGSLIPVVHIKPQHMSGVLVTKMTGHNARFIRDEGIGPGSIVECVRAGGVIPKIVSVVSRSKEVTLPEGVWCGVHIKNESSNVKAIVKVLVAMGVKHVSVKTVEKMYNVGLDTIFKVLHADKDLFSGKSGANIVDELQRALKRVHVASTIIAAAGALGEGIGEKRVEQILSRFGSKTNVTVEELCTIDGVSKTIADKVVGSWSAMNVFINECKTCGLVLSFQQPVSKPRLVVSGFRSAELESRYTIVDNVTPDCVALVVKTKDKQTTKVKQALKNRVQILTLEEFTQIEKSMNVNMF
jgi:NAD-dependent DNA ligase